jgi:hypothetical protein
MQIRSKAFQNVPLFVWNTLGFYKQYKNFLIIGPQAKINLNFKLNNQK